MVDQLVVPEHAGTFVLFNIIKIVDTELTIRINIEISNAQQGEDFRIIPSTALQIPAENSSVPVGMQVIEDHLAEDSEYLELRLRATVVSTPIHQQFLTGITIQDNEVVLLGFVGEEERTVVEGSVVEICADLFNITVLDYLRFDDTFPVSTIDGTARAGEDYVDTSSVYRPALGSKCVRIQTIDNGRIEDPRYFTLSFGSGPENHLTVILPSSIRVVLMDNDAPPQAPSINSVSRNENLTILWMAESTPTQPIVQFVGTITVGDRVIEFNTSELTRTYTLVDFEVDKTHVIAICAENVNGRSCSDPFTVDPPPMETTTMEITTMETTITPDALTDGTNAPAKLSPGLIAGIAVVVAALLCCCLLLLFLLLCVCCWKVDRGKSYFPGKAERKEIRGRSPVNSSYSDDYSIESDLQKAPL